MTDQNLRGKPSSSHLLLIIGTIILTRLLFLLIMPAGAVSEDMHHWLVVDQLLSSGANPYNESTFLNWPPLWMQTIRGLSYLGSLFDTPLYRMIQLFLILVEASMATVMWLFARFWLNRKHSSILVMIAIVCNPISILLICQHCNFDIIVALWVLLACYFHVRYIRSRIDTDWLWTCLFIGLGVLTKTTPLVLFPILFNGIKSVKPGSRVMGAFLVVFPTFLGISVLFVLGPEHIMEKVLSYRSYSGYFGFTGILNLLSLQHLYSLYRNLFLFAILVSILGTSIMLARSKSANPRASVLLATMLLMVAPIFGPGYAPQYIYWYMPILGLTFTFFDKSWKACLILLFVVGSLTYIVEYGFFISHGAYLLHITQSQKLLSVSIKLSTAKAQTLIRLPMFLAYLLIFLKGVTLIKADFSAPAPVPGDTCSEC